MKPFEISASLATITRRYPSAEQLIWAVRQGQYTDRVAIARQWLSEGIPFAFQECPALYESLRSWLSWKLGIRAKEISLVGSARVGSSLAPRKLGNPFGPGSDLDIFVVSECLFVAMGDDYRRWRLDYQHGRISPRNPREEKLWEDNRSRGKGIIRRGFIDSKMIPTRGGYDSRSIHQAMWLLVKKLEVTGFGPILRKSWLRCYNSWESVERQISINLKAAADSLRT